MKNFDCIHYNDRVLMYDSTLGLASILGPNRVIAKMLKILPTAAMSDAWH